MLLTHNDGRWLDRLTNLASSVRTEVLSPESSHERDDATRFFGIGSRTRTQLCPGRRAIRTVGRAQVDGNVTGMSHSHVGGVFTPGFFAIPSLTPAHLQDREPP